MNRAAIAMQLNDRRFILAVRWPRADILLVRLKRKAQRIALGMAMAIIPLPSGAVA